MSGHPPGVAPQTPQTPQTSQTSQTSQTPDMAEMPAPPAPPAANPDARGTLYLVPVPLGPDQAPDQILPPATISAILRLDCFVAESAKTARAVLKRLPLKQALQTIEISELNEHTSADQLPHLLAPLLAGRSIGLLSEAGCPAVADPGSALVALAHRNGIRVVPLVGPSSLLLALMASGMSGQTFAFVGYLPVPADQRKARIQQLERRAIAEGQTQIIIETPYRNQALLESLLEILAPDTLMGAASALSLPEEQIRVAPVSRWREAPVLMPRSPTVFTVGATQAPRNAAPQRQPISAASGQRRRR